MVTSPAHFLKNVYAPNPPRPPGPVHSPCFYSRQKIGLITSAASLLAYFWEMSIRGICASDLLWASKNGYFDDEASDFTVRERERGGVLNGESGGTHKKNPKPTKKKKMNFSKFVHTPFFFCVYFYFYFVSIFIQQTQKKKLMFDKTDQHEPVDAATCTESCEDHTSTHETPLSMIHPTINNARHVSLLLTPVHTRTPTLAPPKKHAKKLQPCNLQPATCNHTLVCMHFTQRNKTKKRPTRPAPERS